jgi:hypothetical protein
MVERVDMTITPTPEQERTLAQAMEDGLIQRPEEALDLGLDTLRSRLATRRRSETAEEWIARFHAFVHSHSASTPLLTDEAISRESIYGDRGL